MSYADDRLSAADMLAEDGQSMTLAYPGGATYDPATGSTSGAAAASQTVKGVILPLDPFRKAQGNVVEGAQQCLLAALNTSGVAITAPKVNGTITDANSSVWTIIAAEPLSPAGTDVIHDLIVKRAA